MSMARSNVFAGPVYGHTEPLMMTSRKVLLVLVFTSSLPVVAQEVVKDARSVQTPVDAYQSGWQARTARSEAELWKELGQQRPQDVQSQFNWYRSERNARLQENNGKLTTNDRQALQQISDRVDAAAAGGFESKLTAYYEVYPDPASFTSIREAAELAPERQELIAPMLNLAVYTGDKVELDRWASALETRGALSSAFKQAASDLLLSVDDQGVLVTNGDMDLHPTIVLQRRQDKRRDVLLVDQRMLGDAAYRKRIWSEAKAKGPVPGAGPAFVQGLEKSTERPVFLSMGLDATWFDAFHGRLSTSGTAFRIGPPVPLKELDARWKSMKKPMGAGPLSRNYLLPGAVLLRSMRAAGDEARTVQLELELRNLARQLGAENDLLRTGVLQH